MSGFGCKKDLEEMTSNNGYDLDRNKPSSYSSGMFSKLAYEDLKKAHTETVVPVTHDDYLKRKNTQIWMTLRWRDQGKI